MKRTGRTTLNKNVFHVLHGNENTADLGIPECVNLEAQYHSTIPAWVYNILVRAFAEEKRKHHQADFDDCDFVLSLKLPTFQFSLQGGVTTANYFMGRMTRSDAFWQYKPAKCYHRRGWLALHFKTHKSELRSSPIHSKQYQYCISSCADANVWGFCCLTLPDYQNTKTGFSTCAFRMLTVLSYLGMPTFILSQASAVSCFCI